MKGVIYARYSSDNQREESIDGQVRECLAYAEKNGIQIVETYIDRAMTAKTDKRPDFQRMIKDSYKKGFDVVIVWKLDRFARNRFDSAKYKMILRQNEVRVLSATEAISTRPEGILMESMLEGWAEYYSAESPTAVHFRLAIMSMKSSIFRSIWIPLRLYVWRFRCTTKVLQ